MGASAPFTFCFMLYDFELKLNELSRKYKAIIYQKFDISTLEMRYLIEKKNGDKLDVTCSPSDDHEKIIKDIIEFLKS